MSEQNLTIMMVDDHQMFIDGLKSLIRKVEHFKVIAEANSGEEAMELLEQNKPDLVITDINMPGMSGTELTKIIKTRWPDIKVLVLSMYDDPAIVREILECEAEGYVLKNTGKGELVDAIKQIADDGTFYSRDVMKVIMSDLQAEKEVLEMKDVLSDRELEILKLIVAEYTTKAIAEELNLSPLTIDTHRKNILKKTGCKTLVGLIKYALTRGVA